MQFLRIKVINSVTMVPFFLGSKNTIRLQPIVFEGNSLIKLDRKQLFEYNKETQLGIYNLHLELSKYMVCPSLRIPMISNGNLAPTFKVVKCSYDRYHLWFNYMLEVLIYFYSWKFRIVCVGLFDWYILFETTISIL
jgi:hypothetical protein